MMNVKKYGMKARLVRSVALLALTLSPLLALAATAQQPGQGVSVTPIFPSIAEERFRGEIAMAGLKELGYDVQAPKETDYPAMMLALSYGDADFTVHMWDMLHASFYSKAGGDDTMVKTGNIMPGVLQGYMIDKKTADAYHITSVEDLKKPEIAKLFDSNGDGKADMTGCNPGWGCEVMVEHHMKAYGLEKTVTDNRGSYFALMADTIARYQQGKPILYFTWVPQWISSVLVEGKDVVWLSVARTDLPGGKNDVDTSFNGKNLGFPVDTIKAVFNKEFAEKNPVAVKFLSEMQISTDDESAQNLKMHNGENSAADIKRHAAEWITAHRAQYDSWLADARAAASK
ncbi:Glycine betaine/L-proline transport substrate-binding protein ProX [Pseudomonas chlororaphis subsp. aurantiaca]|nr:Glycine betaine/L-proline transport substrate-binding protein ProX [Pseudomonas chlororaphis subsp. aurantiaca]AZD42803.1 Glycine betaine/L-proline transport substrate-binding protein ProX [Pseudomonas chlororaphis subsp. aurantiaca]